MAKLSIIVPVYQVEAYLERCLKSILSQTFADYEIILVDDGSTDGSGNICDAYAGKFDFIDVIHKKNGGLSSARNVGIKAATGEYIMFVDSDDLIHSKSAELEIALLEEHNAQALICPLKRFSKEDQIDISSPLEKLEGVSVVSGVEAEKGFFNNPQASKYVSSCGKIFRRSLFDDIRFPEGRLFEDEFTTYKLYYKCARVVIVDTELYFYFINESGITQNMNLSKRFDEYDAQEERISFFNKNGEEELYHLALLDFLRTAQWDLIDYQNGNKDCDKNQGTRFQSQYKAILKQAEKEKLVTFANNFDYYVLAYPKKKTIFRLKRFVYKTAGKMK